MSAKKIVKKMLIKVSKSSMGPKVQELLRGMSEIVDMNAGRSFREHMTEKLSVSALLDVNNATHYQKVSHVTDDSKIKIRFYHCNASTFNVIETVCKSFNEDAKYDVLIVLFGNDYSKLIAQMNEKGYSYVPEYDYDMEEDRPDISVIYHLEILYPPQLQRIRELSKYVVLVPLSIGSIWFGERTVSRMHLDDYKADVCFVGNLCYDRLENVIGKNVIEKMSPPQFDLLYDKFQSKGTLTGKWKKLEGKKTVMLMTDHGLKMNLISDEVSFDLYIKSIIDYAKENQDFGIILRLHFALVQELLSTYWRLADYNAFVEYCDKSPNIVWDDSDDYLMGLSVADASLIDVNCSLVYYALAAMKPIGVPLRYDMKVDVNNPELLENYYAIRSVDELRQFLDMVKLGKDSMFEKRKKACEDYVGTLDGKNGLRIKQVIDKRYAERFNE